MMLEVTIWSLFVGNLGWQAMLVSGWLRWRQIMTSQQHQEEEEILTCFESKEDLASTEPPQRNGKVNSHNHSRAETSKVATDSQLVGWEYKIVRASRNLFRNPTVFQQLCQEEAISGWILLEKLDDRRVRFKRLIALRDVLDVEQLPHDPYRCHYGSSFTPQTWVSAIAVLTVIIIPSVLGFTLASKLLNQPPKQPLVSPSGYDQIPPQAFPPKKIKK